MTTTMTRRSVQHSTAQESDEPKTTTNTHSCVFTIVAAIARTSRALTGFSRVIETLRNCVSLRPQERVVTMVSGKCECSN